MSKRSDKIADAFERIRIDALFRTHPDVFDRIRTGAVEQLDQMGVGYTELDDDESEGEK